MLVMSDKRSMIGTDVGPNIASTRVSYTSANNQAAHAGQEVDAPRFVPELDHDAGLFEVIRGEPEAGEAEGVEHRDDAAGVVGGGFDPDVEIFRVAGMAVRCDGVAADDQESHPMLPEELEQVLEVTGERVHVQPYHGERGPVGDRFDDRQRGRCHL